MAQHARNRFARRGFTLVELLLVLVLLLALVGLVTINVQGIYNRHRLREAAESVREHLVSARMRALETGVIHQFQYELGGTQFAIGPFETLPAGADGSVQIVLPETGAALPETMRFELPEVIENSVALAALAQSSMATGVVSPTGEILRTSTVAPPILFAPDGTATDAVLEIVDQRGGVVEIRVRGLTGAVTVGGGR